ncbi:hypothetical protein K4F52_004330 [Lecanicillium sp. MT-2017a]|nr:hypothetical protein K4F52_004330 [Lecanicillium sp. MT-2017a]
MTSLVEPQRTMENKTEIAVGAREFDETAGSYEEGNGGCTTAIAARLAELCGPITKDSYVLDCAAGPGIVIDELLNSKLHDAKAARYAVVEPAPRMMDIARKKIESQWGIPASNIATFVKPAEELESLGIQPSELTHAFANAGIMFFSDPDGAASSIYKLLKPDGVALITTFKHIGYIPPVAKACQQIRPGEDPFKLLMEDEWYQTSKLEKVMRGAGFTDVEMLTMDAPMTRATVEIVADSIVETFTDLWKEKGWTKAEFEAFTKALIAVLREDKENVWMDEAGVHIKMIAHIAICKK